MTKRLLTLLIALVLTAVACSTEADVASSNLSKAADQFEIERRVIFYNGITDTYMLVIEGLCSIEADTQDIQLEVVCKIGNDTYKKHFLGLSDNVSYFVEQLEPAEVDVYHYRVIFRPETIIPNIDIADSVEND